MENLYKSQFRQFRDENIVYLALKFILNNNQFGWSTTSPVHNYTFKFSPFYFFRLNWVGCLFHCNTGNLRKQSFLYLMFCSAISSNLVVGTCMSGATPVYNGNKTSQEFPTDFPFIEYLLDSVYEIISPKIKKKSDTKIRNKNWCKISYKSLVQLSVYYFLSHLRKTQTKKKKKEFE